MLNASLQQHYQYSYEEFSGHIRAMNTVRRWEHTSRFGFVGSDQTSRANSARIVEYFFDSYDDLNEAVHKAERFLYICDYIARNGSLFSRKSLMDKPKETLLTVEGALLRAVHYIFTLPIKPETIDPKHVVALAKVF